MILNVQRLFTIGMDSMVNCEWINICTNIKYFLFLCRLDKMAKTMQRQNFARYFKMFVFINIILSFSSTILFLTIFNVKLTTKFQNVSKYFSHNLDQNKKIYIYIVDAILILQSHKIIYSKGFGARRIQRRSMIWITGFHVLLAMLISCFSSQLSFRI